MFAPHTLPAGTIDHTLRRRREARLLRMRANRVAVARLDHEFSQDARDAADDADWHAAGYASHAQWIAQLSHSDYRTAERITTTSEALRELPAIDKKLRTGEITHDQAAAAVTNATPETDAQIAELAPTLAPSQIAIAVRKLNPPTAPDDQAIYKRRSARMTWTDDRSELIVTARLPHELGVTFENTIRRDAKALRATAKQHGETLEWHQATADALVALARHDAGTGGKRRAPKTTIVHLSEDGTPALLEGAGVISDATAARHACGSSITFIKPHGNDLIHTSGGRCITDTQMRYLYKRSRHCQYPGCTKPNDLEAHHMTPWALGGKTDVNQLTLECPRHHQYIHDHDIRVTGTGTNPIYTSADGRRITADQPHAPPSETKRSG